ncbi:hypothetical protein MKX01_006591, partial [Papaver californicum]
RDIDTNDDATQNMDTNVKVMTKKQRGPKKKYLKAQKQAKYLGGTSSDPVDTLF